MSMSPAWYQSLIKVLLSRFPQSCRHFDDNGVQYLVSAALSPAHVQAAQYVQYTVTVNQDLKKFTLQCDDSLLLLTKIVILEHFPVLTLFCWLVDLHNQLIIFSVFTLCFCLFCATFTEEMLTKSNLVSGRPEPEVYRLLCSGFSGLTSRKNCKFSHWVTLKHKKKKY